MLPKTIYKDTLNDALALFREKKKAMHQTQFLHNHCFTHYAQVWMNLFLATNNNNK